MAERSKTLSYLTEKKQNLIIVTTLSAFIQKIPPPQYYQSKALILEKGKSHSLEDLIEYLSKNKYHRLETVREKGEYSVRGGLVDVFPIDSENPIRLDFFGDEIESIFEFDALSQRRGDPLETVSVTPFEEGSIGAKERERFKNRYRELFGPPSKTDEIYQQTLQGTYPKGIEHWSPLFYENMTNLLDYLGSPDIIVENTFQAQVNEKIQEIDDYYQTRLSHQRTEGELIYNPLPPERLYLTPEEMKEALGGKTVSEVSPLGLPEADSVIDCQTKGLPFSINNNNLEPLHSFLKENKKQKIIFSALSKGACERFGNYLKDNQIQPIVPYQSWEKSLNGPKSPPSLITLPVETGFISPDFILITDHDLIGDRLRKLPKKKKRSDLFIAEASSINVGDYLVHDQHGIGKYNGLVTVSINNASHDCLLLIYEGDDKLFVPVENLDILTRYGGGQQYHSSR